MKKFVLLLSFAALLCACQPKLVIIHFNDTHSHLEPVRGGQYDGHAGVIERAVIVDSIRASHGDNRVLLVHAGDFVQGTSYYTELGGEAEIKMINDLGYDVVTLGNHEFDNGIEHLCGMLKNLETTKVVCANLDLEHLELGQYVKPYAIVEKGGMKIGVIGLEAYLLSNVSRTISSRIQQLDDVECTNRWSDYLKNVEKCDLVILLSHIGYDKDQELVPQTHYLDLVIGGHSHTFVDDFVYLEDADNKKVPIITDGCWGYEVGEITVR